MPLTPFEHACLLHGWGRPADFLKAFETTADVLGLAVTLTDRQLRRWKQPAPPAPRPRAWQTLHALFGCSPTELGFPGPPPGATVKGAALTTQWTGTSVDRRAFLNNSIGAVAGVRLAAHLPSLSPPGESGSIGTTHLLELRAGLRSLYQLDDAYGGDDVRSLAVRHLRRVRRVISTAAFPDTIGRQLHLLAGEIAEHCGWLHFDADDQNKARGYWGEALTAATLLRDGSLEVLVLSSTSSQACHEGRARDGLDLARAAQERATRHGSPVLQSIIAGREARALSLLSDNRTAGRRLAAAMQLIERDRRGSRPTPDWAAFHGPAELDYLQGLHFAQIGRHAAATPFLRAALVHQEASYGRNRALYQLTLAKALVDAGEVDEAASQARGSLEHLQEVESGRVMRRLVEVTGALRAVDASPAREAAEELYEYARAKGAA